MVWWMIVKHLWRYVIMVKQKIESTDCVQCSVFSVQWLNNGPIGELSMKATAFRLNKWTIQWASVNGVCVVYFSFFQCEFSISTESMRETLLSAIEIASDLFCCIRQFENEHTFMRINIIHIDANCKHKRYWTFFG